MHLSRETSTRGSLWAGIRMRRREHVHSVHDQTLALSIARIVKLSGNDLLDDVAGHIGQAKSPTVVQISKLLMLKAEQVEDGGVNVVD